MQNAKQKEKKHTTILTTPLTLLLLLTVACMSVMGHTMLAYSDHRALDIFQTGDITYMCDKNLSDLNYARITPCTEFGKAAATWSSEISNLDLANVTSNAEIIILSGKTMKMAVAEVNQQLRGDKLPHTTIIFSTDYAWGDNTYWLHALLDIFDFRSVALHELGHALGLGHDSNSDLMRENFAFWYVQRTIPAHDQTTVQEKFGDD